MSASDLELLRAFARDQSQDAFTTLVQRHVNLVYSAAFRQVRCAQLAEEVTQSVFTDLARSAARLKPGTVLTAWLYEVTRRTGINMVRGEVRRQIREQIASEMNVMSATNNDWSHIEPLLDEAMHALDETDRAALLLRYFENKSLREVGAALGASDDAAQKRVSRAIERLREFFGSRGLGLGASGLVLVLSANAVQATPAGLAAKISTASLLAGASTAAVTTSTTILMTTLQKVSIAAAVLAVGVGGTLLIQHRSQPKAHALNPAPTLPQQTEYPQASWKFVGYADPESGYQSFMWAMSQGNVDTTLDSLTPAERAKWEGNMKKTKAEYGAEWAQRTKSTELFRVLDKQSVSETETHLRIQSVGGSNENPVQEQWAKMIKVGRDWKYEGWVGN
jgi:RNA polymerase sigma factor (sigma-70 family)